MSASPVYGAGAEFESAGALMRAAEKLRDRGFTKWDVHSPFPIHGMDAAMGLGNSRVSAISLAGGATGLLTAFLLIWWTSAVDYPLITHGKPYFAWQFSMPIFFELTVLFTAFATLFGMLAMNLLPRPNHPVFNWDRFRRVTDDGFFAVIEAADPLFSETETLRLLEEIGGTHATLIRNDS
ncbi:MAG: DUF3341 domain-containing protein [Verrucomicrobiia bacterium]